MRIAQAAEHHLQEVIIPFWLQLRDDAYGGFYGLVDAQLNIHSKAEKGCILHSRILWFFSEAAMAFKRRDLQEAATHAYRFLADYCIDRTYGGIYWSMTYDGKPLDTTKHTYNQAFAIYALSSYYKLTKDAEALNLAQALFGLIEQHCTDDVGYLESFTRDWMPEDNDKLSENGVMAEKTMNTLLHVFEGYSGLYQASPTAQVRRSMERILSIYKEKIYDRSLKRQKVFFDKSYRSLLDLYSFGHDIESSWLMECGCALLNDPALYEEISAIGREMAQAVFENAYSYCSISNECDRGVMDEQRVWWVQAEAVLGFANLWEKLPQQEKFRQATADIFLFIMEYMVDHRQGSEWFWAVSPQGQPIPDKPIVEPWKCPYHNGRMCLELMRRDYDIYV